MNLQEIEQLYHQYTGMHDTGEISKEEYLNLLRGFEIEKAIAEDAETLAKKEELNQIINAAITIVSAVA